MKNLFEAAGGDQPNPGALAFEHRVGRNRRAMQDQRNLIGIDARKRSDLVNAGEHSDGGIGAG